MSGDEEIVWAVRGEDIAHGLCVEQVGVNLIEGMPQDMEPLFGVMLIGPPAADLHRHEDRRTLSLLVLMRHIVDTGHLIGRLRAACEMHGLDWSAVMEQADRTAAATRAQWSPVLGDTGVPEAYQPPTDLRDLGSGTP